MLKAVEEKVGDVRALCEQHGVRRLELFGSAARVTASPPLADYRPGTSDLDFLVEFEPQDWHGASDRYFGLLHGLEDLLGCRIDLVDRQAVTNPHFLPVAERATELLYAA